jgi:DNA sulfur modification protein DndD
MRLLTLTIHNLGVFRGRHDFDFTPARDANRQPKPLTVIGGQNGVGKSTLFQAVPLALHGSLVLGDRVSRQTYNDFLLSRLHRYIGTGVPVISEEASVALSFQYVQSGRPLRIHVERRWQRSGQSVSETLNVLRDGQPPEVAPEDYQDWLNDLFPPGLASVCFFDAEKLDALSSPDQHNAVLSILLRRLLGLNLVERLQNDLDRHLMLSGSGSREGDNLRREKEQIETSLKELVLQLEELKEQAEKLLIEEKRLGKALAEQERRLVAEGGSYASRRPAMQERLQTIEREIEQLSSQLRGMCAELLPFALAPGLCMSLSDRLKTESSLGNTQSAEQRKQQLKELKDLLNEDALWQGVRVSIYNRNLVTQRLVNRLRKAAKSEATAKAAVLHKLSEPERERLQGWIAQVQHVVPQQTAFLGERLRVLQEEQSQIEADLRRVPDETVLAPIHAEIARLQKELGHLRRRQTELNEQIGALQFKRSDAARKFERVSEKFAAIQSRQRQTQLAERSRRALHSYHEALLHQGVTALEKTLATSFNTICRKEHLIEGVSINHNLFTVELRAADGRARDLSVFSAGERQLFALALLWALRLVSGSQLPLVIDTPFARLDDSHRSRLVHNFIPQVSDQVILLTTDAEMDAQLLSQTKPYLAHTYSLHFDAEQQATISA